MKAIKHRSLTDTSINFFVSKNKPKIISLYYYYVLFRSREIKRKWSLEVTLFSVCPQILRNSIFLKNWIMGHLIWPSVGPKWTRIELEENRKWTGMWEIYKRWALAALRFFVLRFIAEILPKMFQLLRIKMKVWKGFSDLL